MENRKRISTLRSILKLHSIDSGNGVNSDKLIKFHANNGTELVGWDILGYSKDAQGLVYLW